jgi:hypothetical protein
MQIRPSPAAVLRDLIEQIEAIHDDNKQLAGDLVCGYVECGGLLVRAKQIVGHDSWLGWIAANLSIKKRQCQKYMRAYHERERLKAHSDALLSLDDCMDAVAEPRQITVVSTPWEVEPATDEPVPSDLPGQYLHLSTYVEPETEIEESRPTTSVVQPPPTQVYKPGSPRRTTKEDFMKSAEPLLLCSRHVIDSEMAGWLVDLVASIVGEDKIAGRERRPKPRK